jgi:hypothetical protein
MNTRKRASSLIPVRIGALLISADILTPFVAHQALATARTSGKKLGDVLIAENLLTRETLSDALEVQSLIKTGEVSVEVGTQALRDAHKRACCISEALESLGYSEPGGIDIHDLASVLIAAECITKQQLEQASLNSTSNGLPIGRNLVLSGAITPSTLGATLNILLLLRDDVLGPKAAIKVLKQAAASQRTVEDVLGLTASISPRHVRVGELLSAAGLLSESDAMIAVENALLNRKSIGHALLEYNMVSPLVLDAALKLQGMIEERSVTRQQAAGLLQQVASRNIGIETFLSEMSVLKSKVLELLLDSNIISTAALELALGRSPEYETDMLRALFANRMLTQDLFRAAVQCVYAISDGVATREEMITSLKKNYAIYSAPGEEVSLTAPSQACSA